MRTTAEVGVLQKFIEDESEATRLRKAAHKQVRLNR